MLANLLPIQPQSSYHKQEILKQLSCILSKAPFSNSAVLTSFLKYIVEKTLDGNAGSLKEYTIGVNALGRAQDFNPQIDAIVRIHAGRLRRLLDEYYNDSGSEDSIRIEVVKGSYVPVFRFRNETEPVTEIYENIKLTQDYSTKLTIAILPFRHLNLNKNCQFLGAGLGEELTQVFSTFQEISVISHHSTLKFALQQTNISSIGAKLGVHYLITGSVMINKQHVRVNVGLVETTNSTQVWAKIFDFSLDRDDLMHIQDQVTYNVYSILGGYYGLLIRDSVLANHLPQETNINSFDPVRLNYYCHMNFSLQTYLQSRAALEKIVQQDLHYAGGLSMLAELYMFAYSFGYPSVEDPANESMKLVQKAINLNPECQHTQLTYALANICLKRRKEAISKMEFCLTINPSSASTMGAAGIRMAFLGEYKRALELLTKSANLNLHYPWWVDLGFFLVHYQQHNYQEAFKSAMRINTPDIFLNPLTKLVSGWQLEQSQVYQQAASEMTNKFHHIANNLKTQLSTFLLDEAFVDQLCEDAKKAGLMVL